MELQTVILLLTGLVCCSAQGLDPRGPRPVEAGYSSDKCATQKEWGFCSDEDWGVKCPSGCKILGLMDKHDHDMMKKIDRIRTLLEKHQAQSSSTDRITKQTYDYLKEGLTSTSGGDSSYFDLTQTLRRRIVDMKVKIDRQLIRMSTMKNQIRAQVTDIQRMEVDIDMKLRACKGSCKTYTEFSVDRASYVTLDKQMDQMDTDASQSRGPSRPLSVMKSRPLKELTAVDEKYKSNPAGGEQTRALFSEVQAMQLTLETEGSLTSPATVSKVPGTSSSSSGSSSSSTSSSSASSSSSSGTGSKGITEISGGTGAYSTSCTRSIHTVVTHTPTGPKETREEVIKGGPECMTILESSRGGMGIIFPSLGGGGGGGGGSTSSSSSSSSSSSGSGSSSSFSSFSSGSGSSFSSSSSSSSGSKGITEISGGTGAYSTSTSSCTRRIRTVVTHTPTGPKETREEVIEGGPECRAILESSRGGMGTIYPSLGGGGGGGGSTSSSSSSSTHSLTSLTGGA